MKVSIIIPVFSQNTIFLKECISSILSQTYSNFELIMVCVKGDDDTVNTINTFTDSRIRIVMSNYAMITHQMNLGSFEASGEYSMYFGSDDYMFPYSLREQVDFAETNNSVVCFSDYFFGDANLKTTRFIDCGNINITDVSLVRREEHLKFLPLKFSDGMMRTENVWQKMLKEEGYQNRINHFPKATFIYRQHKTNIHNRGSQSKFKCVAFGKNNLPISLICIKEISNLPSEYFCVYSASPCEMADHIGAFKFRRIILYWDENSVFCASKFLGTDWIHHISVNESVLKTMDNIGIKNTKKFDSNLDILNYIREEDYGI